MFRTVIGVVLGIIFILFVLHVTSIKEAYCIPHGYMCGPNAPYKCCPGTYCNDKCGCCKRK